MLLDISQRRLLAEFFANLSVVWFGAAFIAPTDIIGILKSLASGGVAIFIGIWLIKDLGK